MTNEFIFIDYAKAKECVNDAAIWYTCYQCGKCGRVFDGGIMVDEGGTTVEDDEE